MIVIFRIVISAIVIVATFYFLYWVPFAFIHIPWGIAAFLSYAGRLVCLDPYRLGESEPDTKRGVLGTGDRRHRLHRGLLRADDHRSRRQPGTVARHPHHRAAWGADRRDWGAGALAGAAEAERYQCPNVT